MVLATATRCQCMDFLLIGATVAISIGLVDFSLALVRLLIVSNLGLFF